MAATRSRRDKISLLAELLAAVPSDEIELAASYLCGVVPQEKLGLGWAGLRAASDSVEPPDAARTVPDVELAEVDAVLETSPAPRARARRRPGDAG